MSWRPGQIRKAYATQAKLRRNSEPRRQPKPKRQVPIRYRLLHIELCSTSLFAIFKRDRRGVWSCIEAHPDISWMTRMNHVSLIESWLRKQSFAFSWGPPSTEQMSLPSSGCSSLPLTHVTPAEA